MEKHNAEMLAIKFAAKIIDNQANTLSGYTGQRAADFVADFTKQLSKRFLEDIESSVQHDIIDKP